MKAVIYCQYLLGVGHLFRSLRLAAGLGGWETILLVGGPETAVTPPAHVRLIRQPELFSDASFSRLIAGPGQGVETVKKERAKQLIRLMTNFRPDVLLTEQYPFGRSMFRFELDPCIKAAREGRFGPMKLVCSLRDVISVRKDRDHWEDKVLGRLNAGFDGVLVHSDPSLLPLDLTFNKVDRIPCPVHYTGFIAPKQTDGSGRAIRREFGVSDQSRLVVAGLGGGRVGRELFPALIEAFRRPALADNHLLLFPGPLAEPDWLADLRARTVDLPLVSLVPPRPDFHRFLAAADLAVGLGGYNTCLEIIAARTPALLYPWRGSPEQELRCRVLERAGRREILRAEDLDPIRLSKRIRDRLTQSSKVDHDIDLNGAAQTARLLNQLVAEEPMARGGEL